MDSGSHLIRPHHQTPACVLLTPHLHSPILCLLNSQQSQTTRNNLDQTPYVKDFCTAASPVVLDTACTQVFLEL